MNDLFPEIRARRTVAALLIVAALGFVVRIVLWQISFGTNDSFIWGYIGKLVSESGLRHTYQIALHCNQPPGQPYLAAAAYQAARLTNVKFPKWFKLPMMLADVLVAWLIWKIVVPRRGRVAAAGLVALFAWNPVSMLVSAHHGNADSLYVGLALLAVWLMEDRRRIFLGGLVLGAAINVKLVPVLLIPPLLACCRNRFEVGRLLGALAIMAIPSLVFILLEPQAFTERVLLYLPAPEHWGIGHLLLELHEAPNWFSWAEPTLVFYNEHGRKVLLAAIIALSIVQWWTKRWDRYTLMAITFTLFLVLASGFGIQYTVAAAAILLVTRPQLGVIYGLLCGGYLVVAYLTKWDGKLPIVTMFTPEFNYIPGRTFGLLAWAVLIVAAVRLIARPAKLELPTVPQLAPRTAT